MGQSWLVGFVVLWPCGVDSCSAARHDQQCAEQNHRRANRKYLIPTTLVSNDLVSDGLVSNRLVSNGLVSNERGEHSESVRGSKLLSLLAIIGLANEPI